MKSCALIYNPNSGKGKTKIENYISRIKNIFFDYGYSVEAISTKYKGHAIELVENMDEVDLVVSIGGDGTFNEIMSGNFKRKKKLLLSHIPIGTTNDLGNMFGYSKSLINNVKLLLSGSKQKMDICTINDSPFVYFAGFGKFVNISYDTPRKLKEKFGYFAYLTEALREFNGKIKLYDLSYEIDGKVHSGKYSIIMISNANRIAGIKNFYKDVKLNDYKFEVLFCKANTKKEIIKALYCIKSKDITKSPQFEFYKTDNLKITLKDENKCSWSIDGEKFQTGNVCEIKIVKGVEVLIPNKNVSKLFI